MSTPRIRDAGDAAVLLELEPIVDPRVNARATAIAEAIRALRLHGVRDVVSAFRSVAVYIDPLTADAGAVRDALERASNSPFSVSPGRSHEVPVAYGGDEGPDLADVAACAQLPVEEVIARHAARVYRVFMLGFLPGFAYMGSVDERIAAPRRPSPRVRVPAGSVGIAGRQTGVYPLESPGGWQIIGRTPLTMFDPARTPAALFAPGDTVRFVPMSREKVVSGFSRTTTDPVRLKADAPGRYVTVVSPGLFTTIQDSGRWGHQASGVTVAGPMDAESHDTANRAVGNAPDAATLEVTLIGPDLRFEHEATVAVAGADLEATLDGSEVPLGTACRASAGSTLRFGARRCGARAYVAFAGGIDVPSRLGSRATHVVSGLGGLDGRALRAGDRIPLGPIPSGPRLDVEAGPVRSSTPVHLRILPGPQDDRVPPAALDELQRSRFQVAPQSNRMGYRLSGGRLPAASGPEMISDATFTGGIQLPPSGEPILLMADRPTTGGYPQIATVITADLPVAGQLAPGDWVAFELCTRNEAVAALARRRGAVRAIG